MALEDDFLTFKKCCPSLFNNGREVKVFKQFECPISILEANVKEYVVDEYESAELLVLRLFDAGIKAPRVISELSGININIVKKLLASEVYSYGHISSETEELTEAGKRTLQENNSSQKVFQYALYDVKRNLQVESLTGTIIKPEAEIFPLKMKIYNEKFDPNFFPKGPVVVDDEFSNEINRNLQYYVDHDYLKDGNTIESIGTFISREVRYRKAYYVYMDGFSYPFIALPYREEINNRYVNAIEPTAIAFTDSKHVKNAQENESYLIRNDSKFFYIAQYLAAFADL